jgi:hypothetical protein
MSLVCLQYSTRVPSLRIRNGPNREQLIEICSHGSKHMGSSQSFCTFFFLYRKILDLRHPWSRSLLALCLSQKVSTEISDEILN